MAKYTVVIVDHETQKAQTLTGDEIAAIAFTPKNGGDDFSADAVIDCRKELFADWLRTNELGDEVRQELAADAAAFFCELLRGAGTAEREASEPRES